MKNLKPIFVLIFLLTFTFSVAVAQEPVDNEGNGAQESTQLQEVEQTPAPAGSDESAGESGDVEEPSGDEDDSGEPLGDEGDTEGDEEDVNPLAQTTASFSVQSVEVQNGQSEKVIVCHYPKGNLANPQLKKHASWEGNEGHSEHPHDFIVEDYKEGYQCPPIIEEPEEATIIAHKIVCDSEEYLPNWGLGAANIDENTAQNFVNDSEGHCKFEEGWDFEYSLNKETNPGDDLVGPAGGDWVTFGSTDSNGMTSTTLKPTKDTVSFREVLQEGYIPFTYYPEKTNDDDVSAEFYCASDVQNYDNMEWLSGLKEDETYYCVAFNVAEPVATVVAQKVVCDLEEYLPNWGEGDYAPIGENTAKDWVEQSGDHCWFEEGWEFEWTTNQSSDPGDTLIGTAGDPWTIFGPTDSNGMTSYTFEPAEGRVWFREVLKDGYIPFSKDTSGDDVFDDVSAEFYCDDDAFKYDNRENINGLEKGETYYCVAFNALETPDHVCREGVEMIENGGFETPVIADKTWNYFITGTPGFEWFVEWVTPGVTPEDGYFEIHRNYGNWLPFEGYQYVELDSHGTTDNRASSMISQELETVPGEEYTISFAFSGRPKVRENILNIYWGDDLVDTLSKDASQDTQTDWTEYTYTVTADSYFTKFALADGSRPDKLGTFVDAVSVKCGVEDDIEYPYGIITYPVTDYDVEEGQITLMAEYYDGDSDNDDIVQWAVRKDTCSANTGTVAGNVDGYNDSYTWDGMDFSAPLDTDSLVAGNYCFVFNPKDDGPVDVREARWFTVEEDGGTEPTYACSDGIDNDEDGYTDYGDSDTNDPGCESPTDDDEYNEPDNPGGGDDGNDPGPSTSSSGSRPSSRSTSGQVLGAFSGETCGMYLNSYMRMGMQNDPTEVTKLQQFLVDQGYEVPVNGVFGILTDSAVRAFQLSLNNEILVPWVQHNFGDGQTPTGYVYKTTRYTINNIVCPGSEAFPVLP